MNLKQLIGNDIVDLKTDDAISYPKNLRLVNRIMCEEEQESFYHLGGSNTMFWIHWAAKEAVFKIIKKLDQYSIFSHRLYQLKLLEVNTESAVGFVSYKAEVYPVTFSFNQYWVHCMATTIYETGHIISSVRPNTEIEFSQWSLKPQELASIHSKESLLVRCLVKNILKDLTGRNFEVQRPVLLKKFGPPELWINDKKCRDMDLSMSHDGNYCAGLILLESCK